MVAYRPLATQAGGDLRHLDPPSLLPAVRRGSRADSLAARIEERLGDDFPRDPRPEDLDVDLDTRCRMLRRQIRVRDRALDGVAVAAGCHPPRDGPADSDRLVAQRDRPWILQHEAAQTASRG